MCNIAIFLGIAVAIATVVAGHHLISFLVGALLCGIAETHGRCGKSHIGMTAPFAGFNPQMWFKCASAYSGGGLATSYLVGLGIAGLGTLTAVAVSPVVLFIVACMVGLAMFLRELGIVRFKPPQCDVQTHKWWAVEFGLVTAAGMWGAHIGLALTTVITHGGLYPLVLIAFASGLGSGEWILLAFWVGRVVTLWLTPSLSGKSTDGVALSEALSQAAPSFKATAICGLAILCTTCVAVSSTVLIGFGG
ncbi:MAG: hypothetical protein OXU77_00205 [Gammaproteobacteria bacterium]|nr:hypothetical protein [Gammaproteobacteria bacterium]